MLFQSMQRFLECSGRCLLFLLWGRYKTSLVGLHYNQPTTQLMQTISQASSCSWFLVSYNMVLDGIYVERARQILCLLN